MANMRNIIHVVDGRRDIEGPIRFLMHGW
jgi:hypothetical protein